MTTPKTETESKTPKPRVFKSSRIEEDEMDLNSNALRQLWCFEQDVREFLKLLEVNNLTNAGRKVIRLQKDYDEACEKLSMLCEALDVDNWRNGVSRARALMDKKDPQTTGSKGAKGVAK